LSASFTAAQQDLVHVLQHPLRTYESGILNALDAVLVVVILILLTALQDVLWAAQSQDAITAGQVIQQVFLGVLLGWGGLSSLFYFIGRLARKVPDFTRLAVLVGVAGMPLLLTTLVSVAITAICLILGITGNVGTWLQVHTVLSWVGFALGWPGWFSAMALHVALEFKYRTAMIICGALLIMLLASSYLPFILP
jgi:hypothetical protein